eukprot:CAMPEP_0116870738 /NCGR_PEP_ID=MMETSP0463-20121206/788_1 /TAXON_ID=181622 /ORGANISM="Strombidinopsis sp, Strain SopsisLIS2011" /LENGTH=70 /DNA_ID=CAMNT_0004507859 /DNA_START=938 /DNA_END=1150 /DNA_ORIENTATION=+
MEQSSLQSDFRKGLGGLRLTDAGTDNAPVTTAMNKNTIDIIFIGSETFINSIGSSSLTGCFLSPYPSKSP